MKKSVILIVLFFAVGLTLHAQNYMVVNSEKVFKSIKVYNDALTKVEKLGEEYQKKIDEAFARVEKMYDDYQNQKSYLSQKASNQREEEIIKSEKEINRYQQQVFGQEGDLMKKRVELIKPIQDRVFKTINKYAESNNYDLVLDIASNPYVIYHKPSADKTEDIINMLKESK